jgi:putative membrane protein
MRFTAADHAQVAAAIAEAERDTSGEIFCVVARKVSDYTDVSLVWAAALAFLVPLALIPLGFEPSWARGVSDNWQAGHAAARDLSTGQALSVYALTQALIFATTFALTRVPAVLRLVTPRSIRRARTRARAVDQFMAHGLHLTAERTGVLIFVAMAEHQVEVVADSGIHRLVDQDVWADAVEALARELRRGQPLEGFRAAIHQCGAVLAQHFPPRPGNPNELADRLVEI